VRRRSTSSFGIAYFRRKVSALHTEMFIRIMKDREIEPVVLGELLEDMGNEFLDLAEEIRERVLAANRPVESAGSCRVAGANPPR
jgi:hypothetical protein